MKVLLDTNAYAALFRGNPGVAARVRRAEQVLTSVVVAGELLFGFRNGSRSEANSVELEDFLASPYVVLLPVTMVTADRFGRIETSLRRKGRPLPTNDIGCCQAMESGAEFYRHFEHVDGIVWIAPEGV